MKLNEDQTSALETLQSPQNVFLTGAAGSGKSFLLRHYLKDKDPKEFPILATTGAAAILVGGRTFHSFFGLGILEGGAKATVERASKNKRLTKRLRETNAIIVDEVSMLSASTLSAAEQIARKARGKSAPWGGLRIIAVGDFCQLPPVNAFYGSSRKKEWAFLDPCWQTSEFTPAILREPMRSSDPEFLKTLNLIRYGHLNQKVRTFLDERTAPIPETFSGTRLYSRRADAEFKNLELLTKLNGDEHIFETNYRGNAKSIEAFKKHAPIPESITLREGALVMLRQNDPKQRWVNGSIGYLREIHPLHLGIELLNGRDIAVERADFTLLDADGLPAVTASNFPVTLAYALTIHKAQGTTLDAMTVDLRGLWEPGQAYVALSRARDPSKIWIEGWSAKSIFLDKQVYQFHRELVKPT